MGRTLSFLFGTGAVWSLCTSMFADDWPAWHGKNRNAVSGETRLLQTWPDDGPELHWIASKIGEGYSSVVVSDGRVFTTGRIDEDVYCFAIDQVTGNKIWQRKIGTTKRNVMSTPTVHDDMVYALDPDGELVCLSVANGEIIWQRSFLDDFDGQLMSGRGYGESPLVDGDRLICTPGGPDAMIVALNRRSGNVIWKATIPDIGKSGRDGAAFSSIGISTGGGIRQYVQLVGRGLIGIEAKTGRFLWGYNDISNGTANIPTPIVRDDYVFSANGYHAGSVLLKLESTDNGDGVNARQVYRLKGNRFQNHHGGFVLIGDHVFGGHGSNNGLPTCIDFSSGKVVWKQRGPGTGSASVVAADGMLYFHYQNGVIALIDANATAYQLQGKFALPEAGGDSWAHPVIADARLFLREQDELYAYDIRAGRNGSPDPDSISTPPMFAGLTALGASVSMLPSKARRQEQTLFRYAAGIGSRLPVIQLSEEHITKEGRVSESTANELRQLTTDFALNFAGTQVASAGIRQLTKLKKLVGLSLEFCPLVDDSSILHLQDAQQLRVLIASGTNIGSAGLAHISRLPKLVAIDLEVCDSISDSSCTTIAKMPRLKALVLKKTGFETDRISGEGLRKLGALADLELLNLYGNAIDDAAMEYLQSFPGLLQLDLSLNAISDEGLLQLSNMEQLDDLTLLYSEGFAGPKVTNVGLKSIAELTLLRRLNLVGAKITDNGVDELLRLMNLEYLSLVGTQITSKGVTRIRSALPKCQVLMDN